MNQFLTEHKIKKGDLFTHTALGNPPDSWPASYNIPLDEYDTFLKLFHDSIFNKKKSYHLTEKHQDGYGPILIDLDLRFDGFLEERSYDEAFIELFLNIYILELKNLISIEDNKIEAFVTEKPSYTHVQDKNLTKDGIHIVFPHIIVEPRVQYLARHNTINNKSCKELFKKLQVKNRLSDIFDKCVIETNNWLMYGSNKPNSTKYLLTHVFKYNNSGNLKKIDIKKYDDKQLIKIMSIRNKEANLYKLTEEEQGNISESYETILKMDKTNGPSKKKKKLKPKNVVKKQTDDDEYNLVGKLVEILNPVRVDSYDGWMRLGWCLHNIDYRLLEKWIGISKKSPKFAPGECENEWEMMDSDGLGMGSLCKWAKDDNITKYNEIMKNNLHKVMLDSLNTTHHDIAKVIHQMFKQSFVCASSKKNVWYHFKNHRWNELDDAVELKQKISKEVINEYYKLNSSLSVKASEMDSSSYEKEIILARCKQIMAIITKLKTNSFKKSVISECTELFHIHRFEELLDTKVNLIGFNNGVYDLELGLFREGLPEDYISFCTNIDYIKYNDDSEEIQDVKEFQEQILPIEAVRKYVIRLFSSFLSGKTGHEKFHIWTGCGGNGKSKIIELFRLAFGDYCTTLPITLITEKRARAEGANPALAKTKGKRFAALQEPEQDEKINVGLMKEITGGDPIQCRALFKDSITYTPQFKLVVCTNTLFDITSNDDGTWRRIRVCEFKSKFTNNPYKDSQYPKSDYPYQYNIDYTIDTKFKLWSPIFLSMLVDICFKTQGKVNDTPCVIEPTNKYREKQDVILEFCRSNIEEGPDNTFPKLQICVIKDYFKQWHINQYGNTKQPNGKEISDYFNKKYGKYPTKGWTNISLKEDD